jgi:hypothetical protein
MITDLRYMYYSTKLYLEIFEEGKILCMAIKQLQMYMHP